MRILSTRSELVRSQTYLRRNNTKNHQDRGNTKTSTPEVSKTIEIDYG